MKLFPERDATRGEIALIAVAYVLWIVTMIVSAGAVLQVRMALNAVWVAWGGYLEATSLIDQLCLFAGGLGALIYVVYLEGYYHEAITVAVPYAEEGSETWAPAPACWQDPVGRRLAGRRPGLLLWRFAVTVAIPAALILLSSLAWQVAVNAMGA